MLSKNLVYFSFFLVLSMHGPIHAEKSNLIQYTSKSDTQSSTIKNHSIPDADTPTNVISLGANLQKISDWARTNAYVDLIHQARRFGSPDKPWDEKALLGKDGWPIGDFGVVLMTAHDGVSGIDGVYNISFNGRAQVSAVATAAAVYQLHYDSVKNLSTVKVELSKDANQFILKFTQTGAGIKNLRVIRPGYNLKNPPLFTHSFLDHIKRFETLRFMDWLRTNNNLIAHWSERSTPENTHYASERGVPWEHIIELANQTEKNIWINIPISANDEYVYMLASLLRNTLNRNLKIYVEYSNEIWNGGFKQHSVNFNMAVEEVRLNINSPLAFDGKKDRVTVGYRRIAKRGKEISDIFRRVYGDSGMMKIVRPIFAGQISNPYTTSLGLEFLASYYGPPSQYFYALAGAPYFNLGHMQNSTDLSTQQVLNELSASVKRLPDIYSYEKNVALARWYGMPYFAYEGGTDTFGPGSISSKKAANLDPRIENICRSFLDTWFSNGGGLFMWYSAGAGNWDTQYGAWELTTDLKISNTPKIRCIDKTQAGLYIALSGRNRVPGSFSSLAFVGNYPPYTDKSITKIRYLHVGNYIDYLIMSATPGNYDLILSASSNKIGNQVNISINGKNLVTGLLLQAQEHGQYIDNLPVSVRLENGLHTLRISTHQRISEFYLSKITFRMK